MLSTFPWLLSLFILVSKIVLELLVLIESVIMELKSLECAFITNLVKEKQICASWYKWSSPRIKFYKHYLFLRSLRTKNHPQTLCHFLKAFLCPVNLSLFKSKAFGLKCFSLHVINFKLGLSLLKLKETKEVELSLLFRLTLFFFVVAFINSYHSLKSA